MRILVVGAGSAGRRHALNAAALGQAGVLDADSKRSRDAAAAAGARAFEILDDALAWCPHAAVVAVPHTRHGPVASALLDAGVHVLVEKPLAHRSDEAQRLVSKAAERGALLFVVCNMRFHPGVDAIRRNLSAIGRPLYARAHFGHWLPNMRPGVDYRQLYCARAGEGGGVVLDGIHEIDYLTWLFGPVDACDGHTATLSDLDIDVEDYAAIRMIHAGGVRSEVHLDYLQHCKRRGCEVVGTEGTLLWESEGKAPERCAVRLYRRGAAAWETLLELDQVDTDAPYRAVMERFIAAVRGDAPQDLLDARDALHGLSVALAVRDGPPLRSKDTGRRSA